MQALSDVLTNFIATKSNLGSIAKRSETADHISLLDTLPKFFRSILDKRYAAFKVKGAIGQGTIANVPWVGIFNRDITVSAKKGYYIVLLFAEDMSCCYLSLNQGVTVFEETYPRRLAFQKIRDTADRASTYFKSDNDAIVGPIELKATGHLGKGYERGAIESYRYDAKKLPNPKDVTANFLKLLEHYDALYSIAGRSLLSLSPLNESQYQQAALERASEKTTAGNSEYVEQIGGKEVPPKLNGHFSGYPRDTNAAAVALKKAEFACEIDKKHQTFVSRSKDRPYVEAHHLIPMNQQGQHVKSLDVTANIVALCPMCHKLLHYGRLKDKKTHIINLFNSRERRLKDMGIEIDRRLLLGFYSKDFVEDEA